jgi:zinc transporter ZupT
MRLKPSLKKVVVSLIAGIALALIILVFAFFEIFPMDIGAMVAIFIVASALVYMVWSMFQPEFYPHEDSGEDYEPMFDAYEEEDEKNQEEEYQRQKLS